MVTLEQYLSTGPEYPAEDLSQSEAKDLLLQIKDVLRAKCGKKRKVRRMRCNSYFLVWELYKSLFIKDYRDALDMIVCITERDNLERTVACEVVYKALVEHLGEWV